MQYQFDRHPPPQEEASDTSLHSLRSSPIYADYHRLITSYAPPPLHMPCYSGSNINIDITPDTAGNSELTVTTKNGDLLLAKSMAAKDTLQTNIGLISVSPDENFLLLGVHENGSDKQDIELYRINETSSCPEKIITDFLYGNISWSADSKSIYFPSYPKQGNPSEPLSSQSFFRYDIEDSTTNLISEFNETNYTRIKNYAQPDGAQLLHVRSGCSETGTLYLYNPTEDNQTLSYLTEVQSFEYLGADSTCCFYLERGEKGLGEISKVRRDFPHTKTCVIEETDQQLTAASISSDGILAKYIRNSEESLCFYPRQTAPAIPIRLPENASVSSFRMSSSTTASLLYSTPDAPPEWHTIALTPSEETPSVSSHAEIKKETFYVKNGIATLSYSVFYGSNHDITTPAPTVLHAYGGFGEVIPSPYSDAKRAWVHSGGVFVQANIRGDRVNGWDGHSQAIGKGKENAFQDLICIAEELIEKRICTPDTLGLSGYSTGGLIVASTAIKRPDLFSAVSIESGLLDMLRFPDFTSGTAWLEEFGDPGDYDTAEYLATYSPVHNAKRLSEVDNPPAFFISYSEGDFRVSPYHSIEFSKQLNSAGVTTHLMNQQDIGHDIMKRVGISESNVEMAFLERKSMELTFFHRYLRTE